MAKNLLRGDRIRIPILSKHKIFTVESVSNGNVRVYDPNDNPDAAESLAATHCFDYEAVKLRDQSPPTVPKGVVLPGIGERVICLTRHDHFCGEWKGRCFNWVHFKSRDFAPYCMDGGDVIGWRPLPAPYEQIKGVWSTAEVDRMRLKGLRLVIGPYNDLSGGKYAHPTMESWWLRPMYWQSKEQGWRGAS